MYVVVTASSENNAYADTPKREMKYGSVPSTMTADRPPERKASAVFRPSGGLKGARCTRARISEDSTSYPSTHMTSEDEIKRVIRGRIQELVQIMDLVGVSIGAAVEGRRAQKRPPADPKPNMSDPWGAANR